METKKLKDEKTKKASKYAHLENRCFLFAKRVRIVLRKYWRETFLKSDIQQLIRSSASIGANYIEANDSLGSKDFIMKIKISKKEAKESKYWLFLLKNFTNENDKIEIEKLTQEVDELIKIFSSIIKLKVQNKIS